MPQAVPATRAARIAAVASDGTRTQQLFLQLAQRWSAAGFRVAGVVEETEARPGAVCGEQHLRDLSCGLRYPISQNLGSGSRSCNLDPGGLAVACAAVERAAGGGCDLIVLSKFGKQEAAGGGLADAFRAAIAADIPVLTSVSAPWQPQWLAFAGELGEFLRADADAIDAWWRHQVGG
jgi:hypothetical protein